ncbi:NB-ARC domain-containing protein [Streptomyces arenae]|uniref:NB-ARC domain-containing protein n=1 Tax=Streptomyces arenae TaxID=29301 RepID=UPI002657E561|nr:NB-ARC domain-containing protein [Streptomyces arenae]MCG7205592.1 tetratricopeptide repeat protein [Streptomyces arenae]
MRGEFGVVPARADHYQVRPGLMAWLQRPARTGESQQRVVCGTGGVGKTQLVAQYARDLYDHGQVDVLVWVNATSHSAVVDAFAAAAAGLLGAGRDDPRAAGMLFRDWLKRPPGTARSRPGARWLVVLDDVPHAGALKDLWPPEVPHGRTLITTRNRDAVFLSGGRTRVDVGRFTLEEAVEYVTAALGRHAVPGAAREVAALAEDLGRLPLALSQAVPYMVNRGLDCAAYRARLANRSRSLDDVLPTGTGLPDNQALTVAAAWDLSIDLADQQPPRGLARPLLHLLGMLDPNGVPEPVLLSAPARRYLSGHATPPSRAGHGRDIADAEDAADALANLRQFSLVEHGPRSGGRTARVHQLIQRAVTERLSAEAGALCARSAADALLDVWPSGERDVDLAAALRSNTAALRRCAEDALYSPDAHAVLFRVGTSLGGVGRAGEARDHFQSLARSVERRLGAEHPDFLIARGYLAYWQGEGGDATGAVAELEALLPRMERTLGADHPETFGMRHSLAYWRGQAGDAAGAADAFAELLKDHQRVQVDDHIGTLTVRHECARWRGEAGEPERAVSDFAELLSDATVKLGADHRITLATRHSLARWRGETGDARGAAAELAELLPDLVRVMTAGHPDTLSARNDHARWLGEAGDASGAAAALAELVTRMEKKLGELHPHTLVTRHRLAHWVGTAGDPQAAAEALEGLRPDMLEALHEDDRRVLAVRQDLAYWHAETGNLSQAVAELSELVDDMGRALPADDPDLFTARYNHARRLGQTGGTALALAVAELIQLLSDMDGALPPDAPLAKAARTLLAGLRGLSPEAE